MSDQPGHSESASSLKTGSQTESCNLDESERSRRWREVSCLYLIMTLGTLAVDQISNVWSLFSDFSVLIVALGFIFLPTEWLLKRGESPLRFGIGGRADLSHDQGESWLQRAIRSTRQALWVSLLVFPLFIGGTHLWHTWNGQEAQFTQRAFTRWDEPLRGFPQHPLTQGELNIGARADHLMIKWRLLPNERRLVTYLKSDQDLKLIAKTRNVKLIASSTSSGVWTLSGGRSGSIKIKTAAEEIKFKGIIDDQEISPSRISLGEYHIRSEHNAELTLSRDMNWLWVIFWMQLFLVGLPEEIFYRGYLQTRLDSLVGQDRIVFGRRYNWESAILCSALFAVAHLMTIQHPSRLAVFFPSLLFGWMRRAYHDTLSPAIFHALCNVLSQILWGIYALSV